VVIDDGAQLGTFKTRASSRPSTSQAHDNSQVADATWTSVADNEGKTYGVPFSAQADVLLVRSDWLKKVGMQPPKTWDDLETVAKAFTTQRTRTATARTTPTASTCPAPPSAAICPGTGPTSSTKRAATSWSRRARGSSRPPSAHPRRSPRRLPQELYCTDKVVQPGASTTSPPTTNKAFQTGIVGMYLTGPYAYATADATPVKGKYTAVAPPAGPKGPGTLAEGTTIYAMAGSKRAEDFTKFAPT